MATYHVNKADVQYVGLPYAGLLLSAADISAQQAEYTDLAQAQECADKLHEHDSDGWIVRNAFSERVVYDTRRQ